MLRIELNTQKRRWSIFKNGYIKGFAFKNEVLLRDENLYTELLGAIERDSLSVLLEELNGSYAAIIVYRNLVYVISDKLRSYPIFYYFKDNILITDDVQVLISKVNCEIDYTNAYEFISLGYLSLDSSTLLKDIHYVVAGNFVTIDTLKAKAIEACYHTYIQKKNSVYRDELFLKSEQALERSFERMLKVVGRKPLLLPLSGGYDSRLIACLCKKYELSNVICYTYGKGDSKEVEISRKVAKELGFQWHFVEYTKQVWGQFIQSNIFNDYCRYSGNITGNPCFQELPALHYLKNNGIIENNSVAIPGYYADLLGGSKIPAKFNFFKPIKNPHRYLRDLIFLELYGLNELDRKHCRLILNKINLEISSFNIINSDDILDLFEPYWFIKSRVANFIVNATRMYEYVGLDWYLLLADDTYQKIWYEVPWVYKENSILYNEFMFTKYFEPFKVDFNKPITQVSSMSAIGSRLKSSMPNDIYVLIKKLWALYRRYVRPSRIPIEDVNNFQEVAALLFSEKLLLNYKGVTFCNYADMNAVLVLYYLNLLRKDVESNRFH